MRAARGVGESVGWLRCALCCEIASVAGVAKRRAQSKDLDKFHNKSTPQVPTLLQADPECRPILVLFQPNLQQPFGWPAIHNNQVGLISKTRKGIIILPIPK